MRTAELRHATMIARVVVFAMILLGGIAAPMRAAALPAVTVVPPPDGGEVPDAVIDSQGRIHLVYVKSDDAYYVTSTDQGRTFSHPLRINSDPGTVQPPGMFRGPVVALGKDDQVHVVWWVQLNPTRDAFLPARNINMRPSDNYSVAADRHGNVAVIWTAEAVYANLSRDGGKTFGAPMLANPSVDACECCATRALFGTEDQLYALYRDKAGNMRDMYLLRLDKGAEAFVRTPVSVTRWSFNACPMAGSSLAHWGNKGLVAAWEREFKIYFARMDFTGRLLPPGEILAPGQGKYPVVLSASTGATLVGWKDATRMRWQVYDAARSCSSLEPTPPRRAAPPPDRSQEILCA